MWSDRSTSRHRLSAPVGRGVIQVAPGRKRLPILPLYPWRQERRTGRLQLAAGFRLRTGHSRRGEFTATELSWTELNWSSRAGLCVPVAAFTAAVFIPAALNWTAVQLSPRTSGVSTRTGIHVFRTGDQLSFVSAAVNLDRMFVSTDGNLKLNSTTRTRPDPHGPNGVSPQKSPCGFVRVRSGPCSGI